jgi:hypothetical protein
MKLNAPKIALAGGLYLAVCAALATVASMIGIPGFPQFTTILTDIYGAYGYSVSALGVIVGAFWRYPRIYGPPWARVGRILRVFRAIWDKNWCRLEESRTTS